MVRRTITRHVLYRGIVALSVLGAGACTHSPTVDADRAQIADVASTGIGVANGLQEVNPVVSPLLENGAVGLIGLTALKLGINRIAPSQSYGDCRTLLSVTTATGWGAAINNVALLVAPPLAIASIPVAIQAYGSAWDGSARDTCREAVAARAQERQRKRAVAAQSMPRKVPPATPPPIPARVSVVRRPPV